MMKSYGTVEFDVDNLFIHNYRSEYDYVQMTIANFITNDSKFRKSYYQKNFKRTFSNGSHLNYIDEDCLLKSYAEKHRYEIRKFFLTILFEDEYSYLINLYPTVNIYCDLNLYQEQSESFTYPLYDDKNYYFSVFNPYNTYIDTYTTEPDLQDFVSIEDEIKVNLLYWQNKLNMCAVIDIFDSDRNLTLRLLNSHRYKIENMPFIEKITKDSYEDNLLELQYFANMNLIKYFDIRDGIIDFG